MRRGYSRYRTVNRYSLNLYLQRDVSPVYEIEGLWYRFLFIVATTWKNYKLLGKITVASDNLFLSSVRFRY